MTLQERCDAYASSFPEFPASHLRLVDEKGQAVIYGIWLIGNDYRNPSTYYGAHPKGYLDRVNALFPDVEPITDARLTTLHVFSGSLPEGAYVRCDSRQPAEIQDDVRNLNRGRDGSYDLIHADPPYSQDDAKKYDTPMIDRGVVTRALAGVTNPGGHLVWLDTVWPMFSKELWRTVGRIALIRSTNHRVRLISIFQRVSA